MPILHDAVFSSTSWNGLGIFRFDRIPNKVKFTLKATTKRQRHKFKKFGVVPVPVLEALWHLGFYPGDKAPEEGMNIRELIDYLDQWLNENEQADEDVKWLYHTIIKEEEIGGTTFVKKEKMPAMKIKHDSRPRTLHSSR